MGNWLQAVKPVGPIANVVYRRGPSVVYKSFFLKNTIKNLPVKLSLAHTGLFIDFQLLP